MADPIGFLAMPLFWLRSVVLTAAVVGLLHSGPTFVESNHTGSEHEAQKHQHGDADDDHETPDSPCHHDTHQCCCNHSHVVAVGTMLKTNQPTISLTVCEPEKYGRFNPNTDTLFRPPKA